MASNYPTSIDDFTNNTDNVDTVIAQDVNDLNDAIEAVEAKVGADSSAVTTSHDYKLSGVTGSDKAVSKTGTETLTNKTLTSPRVGTSIADTNGNEIIKTPATGSAVNEITVTNAAANNDPTISATGGDTNIHLALAGKGDGLVKTAVLRQTDTTDSYDTNQVILTGWGTKVGSGSSSTVEEAITFGVTFDSAPIVIACSNGAKDGTAPTDITGGLDVNAQYNVEVNTVSTTGFNIDVRNVDGTNIAANRNVCYTWMAIGSLS